VFKVDWYPQALFELANAWHKTYKIRAESDLRLVVGPSKQASKHTHTHERSEVMLVWDSLRLAPIVDWIARTMKHTKYLAKALSEISLTHLIIRLYLAIDFPTVPFVETGECPHLRVYGWFGAI